MVPYKTRGARRVPETRDCPPAAVPFPKKEARPAEKGSRYVGLAFILLGALLHNLAAEGALAKALLGSGGGDRGGSRRVSEESKFVLYRDLEDGYRWRLRSPDGESLAESPPDTGRCRLARPRYTPSSWPTTRARRSSTRPPLQTAHDSPGTSWSCSPECGGGEFYELRVKGVLRCSRSSSQ
jgi:hypothetical protein